MYKLLLLGLFFLCFTYTSFSQKSFEIEASEGFVFFDYLGDNTVPKYGDRRLWAGYGLQSEITFWTNILEYKSAKMKVGVGYTNYYYLGDDDCCFFITNLDNYSSFLNIKLGFDYKPNWSPVSFLANSSHYILLHKTKQSNSQNRWFTTIDLGLRVKLGKNIKLSFSSPIALSPLTKPSITHRPLDIVYTDYDPWIEVSGINVGISYSFGNLK